MLLFWSWLNNPASVTVLVTGVVGVGAVGNVTVSTNTTWTPVTDGTQTGWVVVSDGVSRLLQENGQLILQENGFFTIALASQALPWSTVATPNTTWNPVLV